MRILFICKRNETYGFKTYTRRSSGLYNSTRFIVESLSARGVHASIVEVTDNNDIDREVSKFKPEVVVLEALWVVPSKFHVLKKLHPSIEWFVHMHSHMPFLAMEGIAIEWLTEYEKLDVGIIANSKASYKALKSIFPSVIYLPNVYLPKFREPWRIYPIFGIPQSISIGCFGAIRPLKNQLLQAMAAIKYAEQEGKYLHFHINASRTETMGEPVLKNLRALFKESACNFLIEHPWYEPEDFLSLLEGEIDIGMQVSLTETFNVVTADYVTAGIPVVTSKEVSWVNGLSKADEDSIDSIVSVMRRAVDWPILIKVNQWLLKIHSWNAQRKWFKFTRTYFL